MIYIYPLVCNIQYHKVLLDIITHNYPVSRYTAMHSANLMNNGMNSIKQYKM